ncbi:Metal-dependent hydrolase [Minicystis rosea]|nr:Metal-dependent hydrolase [Minicystis rosea]
MQKTAVFLAPLALVWGCGNAPTPAPASATPGNTAAPAAASTASAAASRATDTFQTKSGDVKVTPIYHASTLLEVGGKAIYVDPFSKGDFTGLPKADFILITDVHQDHDDPKALDALSTPATKIIAPPAVAADLKARPNVTVIETGKKQSLGLFEVEGVPMYNLQRGPQPGKLFHDKGRGSGYVVTFGDKRFYFSGDTECTPEMKALPQIDVAFVCMNLPYTMPPKEAAECVNAFKPKVLFPYHYAVPGGESSNLDDLKAAIDPKAGVEVRLRKWY